MIGRQQPLGRYELCQNLSIGEGSARTLLKRLTESDYVEADGKQGQRLTKKGKHLFSSLSNDIPIGMPLNLRDLVVYEYAYGNKVVGRAENVVDGVRQRDEAIIQGGYGVAGATTLIHEDGVLVIPPDNFEAHLASTREALLILESLRPEDKDVIVIGSANDGNLAREVSMAAVMTLFEED
jgi:hypothetical protein